MRARSKQTGAIQRDVRQQNTRPSSKATGESIGLFDDSCCDAIGAVAKLDGVANVQMQPQQQVIANSNGIGRQRLA